MNQMANRVAKFGVLIALAFIFSYVEALIPFHLGIPGIKLGLANLVVLTALYALGTKEALMISLVRILLVGLTFGNMYSALYSLCGGLLSFAVMAVCKKTKWFSMVGISVAGGVFHNVGQITVAIFVVKTLELAYYLPVLLIVGAVTGLIIGLVAEIIVDRIKRFSMFR